MTTTTLPYPCAVTVFKDSGKPALSVDLQTDRCWFTFGSHEDCDVRIHAPGIAVLHAMIEVRPDKVLLHGLDYIYPVFIPRSKKSIRRQESVTLTNDEVFMLGKRKFSVSFDSPIQNILNPGGSANLSSTETTTPPPSESTSEETHATDSSPQAKTAPQPKPPRKRRTSLVITASDETFVSNMADPSRLLQRLPLSANSVDKTPNLSKSARKTPSRRRADTCDPEVAASSTPTKSSAPAFSTPQPRARKTPSASRATSTRARSQSRDVESPRAQKKLPFATDDEGKKKEDVLKPPPGRPDTSAAVSRGRTPVRMVTRSASKKTHSLPPSSHELYASQPQLENLSASARRELVYSRLCSGLPATPLRGDRPSSKAKSRLMPLDETLELAPGKSSDSEDGPHKPLPTTLQDLEDNTMAKADSVSAELPAVQRDSMNASTEVDVESDDLDVDIEQLSLSVKDVSLCPELNSNSVGSEGLVGDKSDLDHMYEQESGIDKNNVGDLEDGSNEVGGQYHGETAESIEVEDASEEIPNQDTVVPVDETLGPQNINAQDSSIIDVETSPDRIGNISLPEKNVLSDTATLDPEEGAGGLLNTLQESSVIDPQGEGAPPVKSLSFESTDAAADSNDLASRSDATLSEAVADVSQGDMDKGFSVMNPSVSEPAIGSDPVEVPNCEVCELVTAGDVDLSHTTTSENATKTVDPNSMSSVHLLVSKFEDRKKLSRALRPLALPVQKALHSGVDSSSLPKVSIQVTELESQMKKVRLCEQSRGTDKPRVGDAIDRRLEHESAESGSDSQENDSDNLVAEPTKLGTGQDPPELSLGLATVKSDGNVLGEVIHTPLRRSDTAASSENAKHSGAPDSNTTPETVVPDSLNAGDDPDSAHVDQHPNGDNGKETVSSVRSEKNLSLSVDAENSRELQLEDPSSRLSPGGNDASGISENFSDQVGLANEFEQHNEASTLSYACETEPNPRNDDESGEVSMPPEVMPDNEAAADIIRDSKVGSPSSGSPDNACSNSDRGSGFHEIVRNDDIDASLLESPDCESQVGGRESSASFEICAPTVPHNKNEERVEDSHETVPHAQNDPESAENCISGIGTEIDDPKVALDEGHGRVASEGPDQLHPSLYSESGVEMEQAPCDSSGEARQCVAVPLGTPDDTMELEIDGGPGSDPNVLNESHDGSGSEANWHANDQSESIATSVCPSLNSGSDSHEVGESRAADSDRSASSSALAPLVVTGSPLPLRRDAEESSSLNQCEESGLGIRETYGTRELDGQVSIQNEIIAPEAQENRTSSDDAFVYEKCISDQLNVEAQEILEDGSQESPNGAIGCEETLHCVGDSLSQMETTGGRDSRDSSHVDSFATNHGIDEPDTQGSNHVVSVVVEGPDENNHCITEQSESEFPETEKQFVSEPEPPQPCNTDSSSIEASGDITNPKTKPDDNELCNVEVDDSVSQIPELPYPTLEDPMDGGESPSEDADQSTECAFTSRDNQLFDVDSHEQLQPDISTRGFESHQLESFASSDKQKERVDEALSESTENGTRSDVQVYEGLNERPRASRDGSLVDQKNPRDILSPRLESESELEPIAENEHIGVDKGSDTPKLIEPGQPPEEDSREDDKEIYEGVDLDKDENVNDDVDSDICREVANTEMNVRVEDKMTLETDGNDDHGIDEETNEEGVQGDDDETDEEFVEESETDTGTVTPVSKEPMHSDVGHGGLTTSTPQPDDLGVPCEESAEDNALVEDDEEIANKSFDVATEAANLNLLTVVELRSILKKEHLPVGGPKADLITRLLLHRGASIDEVDDAVGILPTPKGKTPRKVDVSIAPDSAKLSTRRSARVSRRLQLEDQPKQSELVESEGESEEESEEDADLGSSNEVVEPNNDSDQNDSTDLTGLEMSEVQQTCPASSDPGSADDSNSDIMNDEVESGDDFESNLKLFSQKTVKELKEILTDMGVEIKSKARKAELVQAVVDNLPHGDDGSLEADGTEIEEATPSPNPEMASRGSTVKELREMLKNMGLCHAGTKAVLQKRIEGALAENTRRTRRSVAADNTICSSCRAGDDCEASTV